MKITLSLSNEQLSIINLALIEAPYKTVAPLINEINIQIQTQLKTEQQDTPKGGFEK
jgi:hypothetical protein